MVTGISIPVTADVTALDRAMDRAEGAMAGAASSANRAADRIDSSFSTAADGADTMASKSSQAAGALGDLGGVVADGLGFPGLGAAMENAGMWAQGLAGAGDALNLITESTIVKNIAAKAATLGKAAADKVAAGAARVFALGQWALNAAMSANPIGLVVLAIAGLVAAFVIAYKKSDSFRAIVNKAFSTIKSVVVGAITTVKNIVVGAWNAIVGAATGGASKVIGAITGLPGKVRAAAGRFLEAGKALMGKLFEGFRAVGNIGADLGRNLFNGIRNGINAAIKAVNRFLPDKIPLPGLPDIDLPDNPIPSIPALAKGGVVTSATLALIGEAGPEAVIPLSKLGAMGTTVNLTVVAPVGSSPADIGRTLVRYIDSYKAAGGRPRYA